MRRLCLASALVFAFCARLAAQQTITVSGVVTDGFGGILPRATVNVVIADSVADTVTTGGDGRYEAQVPAGVPFALVAEVKGLSWRVESPGVERPVTRDLHLRVADSVIVTATRSPERQSRVTQATTVATAEDVAALGARSLGDVLSSVPGISVETAGREGGLTSVFSRGGESDHNLVLIDGVRVNLSGGGFDVSRVAAGEIDRVEVVRGANSALYGSDAMGAVVQVFTRRASATDAPQVLGSIEGGSFKSFRGDVRVAGGARQRVDYVAGVTARRTDGAFADELPQDDEFDQVAFDGAVGGALGSRVAVRTGLRYSNATGRSVGQIAYGILNTGGVYDTKDVSWYLNVNHSAGARFTGTASVNYFRANHISSNTGLDPTVNVYAILSGEIGGLFPASPRLVRLLNEPEYTSLLSASLPTGQFLVSTPFGFGDFPFDAETRFRRPAFKYAGEFLWSQGQRLTAGYEWEQETNALIAEEELTNHAFFVQQQFGVMDRWFATVGFRVDEKSMYEMFFSPKLSAGGYLLPVRSGAISSVKVFGNIGKGIKSPNFLERFGGAFADPSPGLRVERVLSRDLGVEVTLADQRVRVGATVFNNDYRDLIEFASTDPFFAPDGSPDYRNVGGADAHGVELEGELQRPYKGLTASAGYAFVLTEVIETVRFGDQFQPGQPLLRRPKHSGMFRLGYSKGPVGVHWDTRFVGQRHDSSFLSLATADFEFTEITVNPGYTVSGFGAEFAADRKASIYFRVDNIFGEEYESTLGYPGMPRSGVFGVRFNVGR
jgi:outer membrane cobalamin receptor